MLASGQIRNFVAVAVGIGIGVSIVMLTNALVSLARGEYLEFSCEGGGGEGGVSRQRLTACQLLVGFGTLDGLGLLRRYPVRCPGGEGAGRKAVAPHSTNCTSFKFWFTALRFVRCAPIYLRPCPSYDDVPGLQKQFDQSQLVSREFCAVVICTRARTGALNYVIVDQASSALVFFFLDTVTTARDS